MSPAAAAARLTWPQVLGHRLRRHWLRAPAPLADLVQVVGDVGGVHAQMGSAAALSVGVRVHGATRSTCPRPWRTRGRW